MPSVRVDFRQIDRLNADLQTALGGGGGAGSSGATGATSGPLGDAFQQWGARMRSFWQRRFDKASKGDGTWKPLAEATKIARARRALQRLRAHFDAGFIDAKTYKRRLRPAQRKFEKEAARIRAGEGNYAILRDTGTLFAALQPAFTQGPGQFEGRVIGGIRVGYGGPHAHPTKENGRSATIADIAMFHDQGDGVPKREIIVMPDQPTVDAMAADLARAIRKMTGGSK